MGDKWDSLDNAAKANLDYAGVSEFFRYKCRLKADNHEWENDAEDILTGFIWDESEEYDENP